MSTAREYYCSNSTIAALDACSCHCHGTSGTYWLDEHGLSCPTMKLTLRRHLTQSIATPLAHLNESRKQQQNVLPVLRRLPRITQRKMATTIPRRLGQSANVTVMEPKVSTRARSAASHTHTHTFHVPRFFLIRALRQRLPGGVDRDSSSTMRSWRSSSNRSIVVRNSIKCNRHRRSSSSCVQSASLWCDSQCHWRWSALDGSRHCILGLAS